jgi:Transposase IS116/IS110/IS902 family
LFGHHIGVRLAKRSVPGARLNPLLLTIWGCGEFDGRQTDRRDGRGVTIRSEAAFARHAGVAPIPHWSGPNTVRMIAGRFGNRQLNAALYRIAFTQIRGGHPAHAYYRKRRASHFSLRVRAETILPKTGISRCSKPFARSRLAASLAATVLESCLDSYSIPVSRTRVIAANRRIANKRDDAQLTGRRG